MPEDSRKERWVVYMIDAWGEVVFWNGFQWSPLLKEARIYTYKDAVACKMLRAKKCGVDLHPWDRYGD
jgi:hypothetical protein